MMHPIGSVLFLWNDLDPNEEFEGTSWERIAQDRCIQGAGNKFTAMQEVEAGLPNITGEAGCTDKGNYKNSMYKGAFLESTGNVGASGYTIRFDASRSNSIYGKYDTVQPPSLALNIWRRVS